MIRGIETSHGLSSATGLGRHRIIEADLRIILSTTIPVITGIFPLDISIIVEGDD
jgi:hypothetical protein